MLKLKFSSQIKPTPIKVDWQLISNELDHTKNAALHEYIKKLVKSGHLVTELTDDKGFNLLHHGVLKGQPGKVAFLIETCRALQNPSMPDFYEWVNKPTLKDGFTPMHFASYRGNLEAINTLMRNKANKDALTASGLNMLHVAAQGDSAPSLFVFKELGIDLNDADKRGSTPLHWACFRQSDRKSVV